MNNWSEPRKLAFAESDDTEDHYSRNGFNFLWYWKSKFPRFKITLFTIPNKLSPEMMELLKRNTDWIEVAVHGFTHSSNFECYDWDYDKTTELMKPLPGRGFTPNFKAPGWTITPDLCGYPSGENQAITKDKQAVYKALSDLNFIVTDRHYNKVRRVEGGRYICVDCEPNLVHMHTWDMPAGAEPNGYRQVEEQVGVPWNHETEFKFLSEAWNEGLIQPCKP